MKAHLFQYKFYTKNSAPSTLGHVLSARVYEWGRKEMTCTRRPLAVLPASSFADGQQLLGRLENWWRWSSHCDGLTRRTCVLRKYILAILDQIQDVANPLDDTYRGHPTKTKAFLCHHVVRYSRGFISVVAVQPLIELLDLFNILGNEERQTVLHDYFHVGPVECHPQISGFKTVQQYTSIELNAVSDQICISYIKWKYETLLSVWKSFFRADRTSCFPPCSCAILHSYTLSNTLQTMYWGPRWSTTCILSRFACLTLPRWCSCSASGKMVNFSVYIVTPALHCFS